jgi:aminoglycoside phosphotransferase (APT) family kinase protein
VQCRAKAGGAQVPLSVRYDPHERIHGEPFPHLFARRIGTRQEVISYAVVRRLLNELADAGLSDDGEPAISPYPYFAVTRLRGSVPGDISPEHLRMLAGQLGAALAACHDISLEHVQRRLWANAWSEPPPTPPTATECYSPLRELGGAERLAESVAPFVGPAARTTLLEALEAIDAMDPVLAHGDLYEGHLLLDESGTLTGILDWGVRRCAVSSCRLHVQPVGQRKLGRRTLLR